MFPCKHVLLCKATKPEVRRVDTSLWGSLSSRTADEDNSSWVGGFFFFYQLKMSPLPSDVWLCYMLMLDVKLATDNFCSLPYHYEVNVDRTVLQVFRFSAVLSGAEWSSQTGTVLYLLPRLHYVLHLCPASLVVALWGIRKVIRLSSR